MSHDHSHRHASSHASPREEMRERLREIGLRATRPRLAVLTEMHKYARPLSHLELMERLGGAAYDRATVYRILSDLTEASLLRRMDLGDKIWRYELLDRCRPIADDHAHFLCTECNKVTCLPPLVLSPVGGGPLPPELVGAEIHLRVTGRCGLCASS